MLACSVRGLRRYWLDVRCGCGKTAHIPLRMMASNCVLAGLTVADVLIQLRCQKCERRPASVALVEDPAGHAQGTWTGRGWRVVLTGGTGKEQA